MSASRGKRILILGYGNPGRQDDGLGPALAEQVGARFSATAAEQELDPTGATPDVTVESAYQLNIEDAALAAEHDIVLFADASRDGPEPFELRAIAPASTVAFTSHAVSPESVLALCEDHFGLAERRVPPEAYVLGIRGYEFELAEGLSAQARSNLEQAVKFVQSLIRTWAEPDVPLTRTPVRGRNPTFR